MRIYLSGPISGICDADGKPNGNFPAFNDAAEQLQGLGLEVINPAELFPTNSSWADRVEITIPLMVKSDAVVALPGYLQCNKSRLETHIACQLGMIVCSMEYMRAFYLAAITEWAKSKEPVGHP